MGGIVCAMGYFFSWKSLTVNCQRTSRAIMQFQSVIAYYLCLCKRSHTAPTPKISSPNKKEGSGTELVFSGVAT